MSERSNFHEDELRHYTLKMQNARADGHTIGCRPARTPNKKTVRDMLERDDLPETVRHSLEAYLGPEEVSAAREKADPLQKFLNKFDGDTQARIRMLMGA